MARHICAMCGMVFGTDKQLKNHVHKGVIETL